VEYLQTYLKSRISKWTTRMIEIQSDKNKNQRNWGHREPIS